MAGIDYKEGLVPKPFGTFKTATRGDAWPEVSIGTGITIRNLQRALTDAESIITALKQRAGVNAFENERKQLLDNNAALERKYELAVMQVELTRKELATATILIGEYKNTFREIMQLLRDLSNGNHGVDLPADVDILTPEELLLCFRQSMERIETARAEQHAVRLKNLAADDEVKISAMSLELSNQGKQNSDYLHQIEELRLHTSALKDENAKLHNTVQRMEKAGETKANEDVDRLRTLEEAIRSAEKKTAEALQAKLIAENQVAKVTDSRAALEKEAADAKLSSAKLQSKVAELQSRILELESISLESQAQVLAALKREQAATNTDTPPQSIVDSIQTTPGLRVTEEGPEHRGSLKRPHSPMFGVDISSTDAAHHLDKETLKDTELKTVTPTESLQASPTPHLDELFVGSRPTQTRVTTARTTRTRRKAMAAHSGAIADSAGDETEHNSSNPNSPAAEIEKRRTKRSKTNKAATSQ